jgi:phage terminase Nu1 subunit (DNA packaging protein)
MGDRVNQTELARRLGVSEGAVRSHIRRGMYRKGKDGLFDVDHVRQVWQTSRDPDAVLRGVLAKEARQKVVDTPEGPRLPETSLSRARAAQAVLQAQRQQMQLQREKGELIKTEDAYRACRAVVTVVLERLDGAAAQIGPRVVGLDAAAAERVAREVLHSVRAEIAAMANAIEEVANEKS